MRLKANLNAPLAGEISLAQAKRQPAEILAVAHQDIEGVSLHLGIVPAGMQAVEI
jgi:hypothetical protein